MSCKLDPEELKKLEELFDELYTWDVDYWVEQAVNKYGTWEAGERAAERYKRRLEELLEKLKRGECPSARDKITIREAVLCACTPDQKEMIKRIFKKLRMRWTAEDERTLCI